MAKSDHRGGASGKSGAPSSRDGKAGKISTGKAASSAAPSQRMLRVGELVRHKLAEMLARGEIHDPVLGRSVVTVPEVRLTPDLKLATVYIMPLGGLDLAAVLAALEQNKKYIRREIARTINLQFAPELRFRADETFDEAERIARLMASPKVRQDLTKQDLAKQDLARQEPIEPELATDVDGAARKPDASAV